MSYGTNLNSSALKRYERKNKSKQMMIDLFDNDLDDSLLIHGTSQDLLTASQMTVSTISSHGGSDNSFSFSEIVDEPIMEIPKKTSISTQIEMTMKEIYSLRKVSRFVN